MMRYTLLILCIGIAFVALNGEKTPTNDVLEENSCRQEGENCESSCQCCRNLRCSENKCEKEKCHREGQKCEHNWQCCRNLRCSENKCEKEKCHREGQKCERNWQCCDNLKCNDETKKCHKWQENDEVEEKVEAMRME